MEQRGAFSHIQSRHMTVCMVVLLFGAHSQVPTHITVDFRVQKCFFLCNVLTAEGHLVLSKISYLQFFST